MATTGSSHSRSYCRHIGGRAMLSVCGCRVQRCCRRDCDARRRRAGDCRNSWACPMNRTAASSRHSSCSPSRRRSCPARSRPRRSPRTCRTTGCRYRVSRTGTRVCRQGPVKVLTRLGSVYFGNFLFKAQRSKSTETRVGAVVVFAVSWPGAEGGRGAVLGCH